MSHGMSVHTHSTYQTLTAALFTHIQITNLLLQLYSHPFKLPTSYCSSIHTHSTYQPLTAALFTHIQPTNLLLRLYSHTFNLPTSYCGSIHNHSFIIICCIFKHLLFLCPQHKALSSWVSFYRFMAHIGFTLYCIYI